MGTAAVAIGTAAAIPGTLVNEAAGGGSPKEVCFGHPSGTLTVGAEAKLEKGEWARKSDHEPKCTSPDGGVGAGSSAELEQRVQTLKARIIWRAFLLEP